MAGVRYLLDTNVLSEPVVAQPNPFVLDRIKANGASLAISSVTWQEVLYGMLLLPAGKRRDQIEDYLFRRIRPALPIIGFEERAARWQAEQRASLRQAGRSPFFPDSQVAAIAASTRWVNEVRWLTGGHGDSVLL